MVFSDSPATESGEILAKSERSTAQPAADLSERLTIDSERPPCKSSRQHRWPRRPRIRRLCLVLPLVGSPLPPVEPEILLAAGQWRSPPRPQQLVEQRPNALHHARHSIASR